MVTLHVSVWVEIVTIQSIMYSPWSRSTWACELKFASIFARHSLHMSRSTWACELKFRPQWWHIHHLWSRSTWACELKCSFLNPWHCTIWSRSTWACELKSLAQCQMWRRQCHAPRERVSWNFSGILMPALDQVTLHVSVWVEITKLWEAKYIEAVTLHVSVWVEIVNIMKSCVRVWSRSTWACELKYCYIRIWYLSSRSRSTWACELKFVTFSSNTRIMSHAPRERVSWNSSIIYSLRAVEVTLHVSVWVEINHGIIKSMVNRSRSTWACELKYIDNKFH